MIDLAHIHPMLVHFPLALLPVALTTQLVVLLRGGRLFDRSCGANAAIVLIVVTAATAIVAAVFGDVALDTAVSVGVPTVKLEAHEELGQLSAVVLIGLALINGWFYRRGPSGPGISWASLAAGVAVLAVLLTTAWFGGHLVYDLGVNVAPPS
ncbi:MAG: DUF2231 domain-containing protein [Chromatiaceae bacterium]|nr:DUF2231 domain-containing protein [Gammaproteobacteria bacterium]MCP5298246.1 DUF2231 domain-containing protein [Chromatiaceae bacterium]MCP5423214.1 DUF2231 domain-containing protein [Chromatiaceae bacterium]